MRGYYSSFFFNFKAVLLFVTLNSCTNNGKSISQISGVVKESLEDKDSIFFFPGSISPDYYETPIMASGINNKKFNLEGELPYPHLYYINLKSERNNILQRGGYYFIDKKTKKIQIDSIGECSTVEGKSHLEFTTKFLPFIFDNYNCSTSDLRKFEFYNEEEYRHQLLDYIRENNNSYVALWLLIKRIDQDGYQSIFEESLREFSENIKAEKLWQKATAEVKSFRIKSGEKFPSWELQTTDLKNVRIKLPKAKYTLVDFWFSFCKPCLKEYPALKELYSIYNSKGFNIIGISVDRTNSIDKWQKAIDTHQLPWTNYLDENGIKSSKERITSFPTTFLLDENGKVIKKNMSTKDLTLFLEKELK